MDKSTMYFMRKALGWLCILLAPLSLIFGFMFYSYNEPDFWNSISATYYATSKIWMIGLLFTTTVFFLCYKGYDWKDRMLTDISGVSAFGIICFPCNDKLVERTGLLNLPTNVSHIIHCIFASILFISFAVMILFQFTKGGSTEKKKVRNNIYKVCGFGIVLFMLFQVISSILGIGWMTIVNESFMLTFFGIAWLVKGEQFKRLRD